MTPNQIAAAMRLARDLRSHAGIRDYGAMYFQQIQAGTLIRDLLAERDALRIEGARAMQAMVVSFCRQKGESCGNYIAGCIELDINPAAVVREAQR